ncbi:MAG: aminopeptidase P family protein [Desulfuromonadales bacterium]|nr:aminopeptidase P family protein [Desulfuromonadales bacterium]MBN2791577.1 aminopeptidase P family protein [Desulfuromonadales bacterium]
MLMTEYQQRIERLQNRLTTLQLDGALYFYPIDVFYFCATRQTATLWVPSSGAPVLFVRKSYARAVEEACIDDIRRFPRSSEFSDQIVGRKIGMTFDVIPVQQFHYYQQLLPRREFVDISQLHRELRSLKSPWELERMRHSGAQLSRVFASMVDYIQPGLRELDVAAEFEVRLRRIGGEGLVRMRAFNQELFLGLTVSGENAAAGGFFDGAATGVGLSSAAPHGASQALILPDQPIMLDYTGIFDGYIVDMTRMYVCGRLDPQCRDAFTLARKIQDHIAAQLTPGALCSDLYDQALCMARDAGLENNFMGPPGEQAGFIGHGVGLELDEYPVLAPKSAVSLQRGQTIAVEPKFTFAGRGIVGIENTYAVTAQGGEKISVLSDDLIQIN